MGQEPEDGRAVDSSEAESPSAPRFTIRESGFESVAKIGSESTQTQTRNYGKLDARKTGGHDSKIEALKVHGIGLSLDDFGAGYSSLSHLKRLPLDQLKVDRVFITDLLTNEKDASIARTIIALGRNLNLNVIAEGVETQGQRQFLEREGCHIYQGFLFSPALNFSQFEKFLAAPTVKEKSILIGTRAAFCSLEHHQFHDFTNQDIE